MDEVVAAVFVDVAVAVAVPVCWSCIVSPIFLAYSMEEKDSDVGGLGCGSGGRKEDRFFGGSSDSG